MNKTFPVVTWAFNALALAALVLLHFLSPQYDPAWRMVSEYAGGAGWLLSIMFATWGVGTVAAALAVWNRGSGAGFRTGTVLLLVSALGEFLASVFAIGNPLHEVASFLGILSLPIAAFLVRKTLGLSWPLTWLPLASVLLMTATFGLMIGTFMSSGAVVDPNNPPSVLPPGVIGVVGWANRLLIVAYLAWTAVAVRARKS